MRAGEVRHPERARFGKPLDGVRVLALEQMQALPFATQLLRAPRRRRRQGGAPARGRIGPHLAPADPRRRRPRGRRHLSAQQPLEAERGARLEAPGRPRAALAPDPALRRAGGELPARCARTGGARLRLARGARTRASSTSRSRASDTWRRRRTPTRPAYAPVAEAMAGLYEPLRKPGEPPPVVVAGALGDNASALYAVIGTLAALRQRERTGRGQHVDVAMFDAMIAMTDMVPFMWSVGEPPSAATSRRTGIVDAFAARDGHFVVAVLRDHQFERLAALVGHPEWVRRSALRDARGLGRAARRAWCAPRSRPGRAGSRSTRRRRGCAPRAFPAGPSNEAADLVADAHVQSRDMLIEVPRADGARPMLVSGNPVKLSDVSEGPVAPDAATRRAHRRGAARDARPRRRGARAAARRGRDRRLRLEEDAHGATAEARRGRDPRGARRAAGLDATRRQAAPRAALPRLRRGLRLHVERRAGGRIA